MKCGPWTTEISPRKMCPVLPTEQHQTTAVPQLLFTKCFFLFLSLLYPQAET